MPNDKPSSVAQTAHCVRIIFYVVKSLWDSRMNKPRQVTKAHYLLVSYIPLANEWLLF